MFLLTISNGIRFGEAKVPGPESEGSGDGPVWSLSVCNLSGMQGKTHVLASIASDILAISETHMTTKAKCVLQGQFRSGKSHYTHLVAGAPVAPRSDASDALEWQLQQLTQPELCPFLGPWTCMSPPGSSLLHRGVQKCGLQVPLSTGTQRAKHMFMLFRAPTPC